jgi:hypothetical protein
MEEIFKEPQTARLLRRVRQWQKSQQFSLRDMVWLVLFLSVACGWWADAHARREYRSLRESWKHEQYMELLKENSSLQYQLGELQEQYYGLKNTADDAPLP